MPIVLALTPVEYISRMLPAKCEEAPLRGPAASVINEGANPQICVANTPLGLPSPPGAVLAPNAEDACANSK
jgi:hypothetical protein